MNKTESSRKILWRFLGAAIFAAVLLIPAPQGMPVEAKRAAAAALLMSFYWITEALPLAATSLIPLAIFPFLAVLPADQCAKLYSDPNIFLFMGGFFLALAMQKSGLEKRIALNLIHFVGTSPRRLLAGFLLTTALISMWVSNTATTLMLLPIALAVLRQFESQTVQAKAREKFALALMLGIAYASSIGGIGTLVGTPPNMIFAGQAPVLFPQYGQISFAQWFFLAFPIAAGFLVIAWVYLTFVTGKGMEDLKIGADIIAEQKAALGFWRPDEIRILIIFVLTALAWVFRADIPFGNFKIPGWTALLNLKGIHDSTVAMAAAVLLFLIPSGKKDGETLLTWSWAVKIPWDVLLLFGGGFALAEGIQASGLAAWLSRDFSGIKHLPLFQMLLLISTATTFLSEIMSNSPQVTVMLPLLAAASKSLSFHPYWLMIPATLMSSLAFMMPAGTPPNAIVFSSGYVKIRDMALTGLALNLLAAVWASFAVYWLLPLTFGIPRP